MGAAYRPTQHESIRTGGPITINSGNGRRQNAASVDPADHQIHTTSSDKTVIDGQAHFFIKLYGSDIFKKGSINC